MLTRVKCTLLLVLRGPFRHTRYYIHSHQLEGDCVVEGHSHLPCESCPDRQLSTLCDLVGTARLHPIKVQ